MRCFEVPVHIHLLKLLLFVVLFGPTLASAQPHKPDPFQGLPFIQNYSPRNYLHLVPSYEHTAILQDAHGAMLIGSHGGILRYNGTTWQLIKMPGQSLVWGLSIDRSGRVYVSATDNLGYLETDATGQTRFVSLLAHLPKGVGPVGEVWNAVVTPEGVYYKSNKYLMRWHQNGFRVWKAETAYGAIQWLDHKLVVQVYQRGLYVIENDELKPYSLDEQLAQNRITFLLPLRSQNWLIGMATGGLFYFNGQQVKPVPSQLQEYLVNNIAFHAVLLPNGNIALATLKGGIVLIDQEARVQSIITKESRLPTNTVYYLAPDSQGGLWVSMEKGISRIRLGSGLTLFNEQNGIHREGYAMATHQGQVYVGTTDGLFILEAKKPLETSAHFRRVPGFNGSVWSLRSMGTSLLIASDEGLGELHNGKVVPLPATGSPWENYSRDVQPSTLDTSVFFKASMGLYAFRKRGQSWKQLGKVQGVEGDVSQLVESPTGDLWLVENRGVVRVQFPKKERGTLPDDFVRHTTIERFGADKGLPAGKVRLYIVKQDVLAQVGEPDFRLYKWNGTLGKFEVLENFGSPFGLSSYLVHPAQEKSSDKDLWLWAKYPGERSWQLMQVLRKPQGGYRVNQMDISGGTEPLKHFLFRDNDNALWFTGVDGLVRYAYREEKQKVGSYRTLLQRVILPSDSVVYPTASEVKLPYEHNSLRFEFAAPSFNGTGENRFQYRLDGYDQGWSAWSPDYFKDYTRIPEGTYTFRVRARNAQGQVGDEAVYTFTIRPPWYRTLLMYILYLAGSVGLVWGLLRWRSSRIEAEKAQLERVVQLRTREVADKNTLLSHQTQELARQAEKLRELDQVKTRFYANISHEFRTPLTLILNNLLDKLSGAQLSTSQEHVSVGVHELNVMSRNARRLLQLINQLLDLSKLESGHMVLHRQDVDLRQVLSVVYASFTSLAEYQRVHFELQLPDEPVLCQQDEDKLEKILYNLLSNAFKFTPAEGKVLLKADVVESTTQPDAADVRIMVKDSGPGIQPDQLDRVFDRFYQGEQLYSDAQGTGIGLALVRELVELHQGRITVSSEAGQGACFQVLLPLIPPSSRTPLTTKAVQEVPIDLLLLPHVPTAVVATHQVPDHSEPGKPDDQPIVLVVEDNDDLRAYIKAQLEPTYQVLESMNGAEGLTLAQETIPDLVISDRMMPVMDGNELCKQLKAHLPTSHIPVILLTALASTEEKVKGLETGADDYLTKPFDARELHVRIHNLIESRKKLREHFSREIRLEPTGIVVPSAEEKFLQQVMQIVEDRMGDSDFSVDEFSREVGMSRVHLHRKLKALTGQSPSDFIRMIRLKRAAQLLDARAGNVAEVAYQVGFNNLSYFSRCFREQFGRLPNEYASRPAKTW
ncbi:ATP-binding protein [Telluribacter sp. SYSU D00476]|uniref:ATP-binding protein n=1 Tax=Telluribacter sp. SYSU D00476 TaxID=2811430 RepID=UPI001FF26FB4|nr:ATP-binding protein [Telluribacter sp. SYSU D00476]